MLLAVLVIGAAGIAAAALPGAGFLTTGLAVPTGILPDRIPGLVQVSAGTGKEPAQGRIFTTPTLLSGAFSPIGVTRSLPEGLADQIVTRAEAIRRMIEAVFYRPPPSTPPSLQDRAFQATPDDELRPHRRTCRHPRRRGGTEMAASSTDRRSGPAGPSVPT